MKVPPQSSGRPIRLSADLLIPAAGQLGRRLCPETEAIAYEGRVAKEASFSISLDALGQ